MSDRELGALQEELAYFEENRKAWLKHYRGKWLLIKGRELIAAFDTPEAAYEAGLERFGLEPFLIKPVLDQEEVHQMPALTTGLLDARY